MKNFVFLLLLVLWVQSSYGNNSITLSLIPSHNVASMKIDDNLKIESLDWKVRGQTIQDDGCNGVFEYQELVYDWKTMQWVWFTYRMDCLCKDCACSC